MRQSNKAARGCSDHPRYAYNTSCVLASNHHSVEKEFFRHNPIKLGRVGNYGHASRGYARPVAPSSAESRPSAIERAVVLPQLSGCQAEGTLESDSEMGLMGESTGRCGFRQRNL
jgi:hypothetical protein